MQEIKIDEIIWNYGIRVVEHGFDNDTFCFCCIEKSKEYNYTFSDQLILFDEELSNKLDEFIELFECDNVLARRFDDTGKYGFRIITNNIFKYPFRKSFTPEQAFSYLLGCFCNFTDRQMKFMLLNKNRKISDYILRCLMHKISIEDIKNIILYENIEQTKINLKFLSIKNLPKCFMCKRTEENKIDGTLLYNEKDEKYYFETAKTLFVLQSDTFRWN